MNIYTETSIKIKEARLNAGITQRELAEKMGLNSPQSISMIERGNRNLSISLLYRIAKELNCEVNILLKPLSNLDKS